MTLSFRCVCLALLFGVLFLSGFARSLALDYPNLRGWGAATLDVTSADLEKRSQTAGDDSSGPLQVALSDKTNKIEQLNDDYHMRRYLDTRLEVKLLDRAIESPGLSCSFEETAACTFTEIRQVAVPGSAFGLSNVDTATFWQRAAPPDQSVFLLEFKLADKETYEALRDHFSKAYGEGDELALGRWYFLVAINEWSHDGVSIRLVESKEAYPAKGVSTYSLVLVDVARTQAAVDYMNGLLRRAKEKIDAAGKDED